MILLLGGTSETWPLASRLAVQGHRVLVSQATDVPLETETQPWRKLPACDADSYRKPEAYAANIECRCGPLDEQALADLVDRRQIRVIVDAAHPYASAIHAAAHRVAAARGLRCLLYIRPAVIETDAPGVQLAPDHEAAAVAAFRCLRPVLLTTGSRNLAPYAQQARRTGLPLIARILDHPSSHAACQRAGIPPEWIIAGRGPFTVETNRRQIRQFGIGVLVTKDGGAAGGTEEKLQAAQAEGCDVIVVARPPLGDAPAFSDLDTLIEALGKGR
jgi:precorrin-6A/cobalt-precorrin-6A reductase